MQSTTRLTEKEQRAIWRERIGKRVYAGTITIPDSDDAKLDDSHRVKDLDPDSSAILWSDGSQVGNIISAGVAFESGGDWILYGYPVAEETYTSGDAEIYGISSALAFALKWARHLIATSFVRRITTVRVYMDDNHKLRALQNGKRTALGPYLPERGIYAIEDVFDITSTLQTLGASVELVWVKSHWESEGNRMADHAATKATRDWISELKKYQELGSNQELAKPHPVVKKTIMRQLPGDRGSWTEVEPEEDKVEEEKEKEEEKEAEESKIQKDWDSEIPEAQQVESSTANWRRFTNQRAIKDGRVTKKTKKPKKPRVLG